MGEKLADGRVEAEVEGSKEAIDELVKQLRIGPRLSHITAVDVELMDAPALYRDFRVR